MVLVLWSLVGGWGGVAEDRNKKTITSIICANKKTSIIYVLCVYRPVFIIRFPSTQHPEREPRKYVEPGTYIYIRVCCIRSFSLELTNHVLFFLFCFSRRGFVRACIESGGRWRLEPLLPERGAGAERHAQRGVQGD